MQLLPACWRYRCCQRGGSGELPSPRSWLKATVGVGCTSAKLNAPPGCQALNSPFASLQIKLPEKYLPFKSSAAPARAKGHGERACETSGLPGAGGAVHISGLSPARAIHFRGAEGAAWITNAPCVYKTNEQYVFQEGLGYIYVRWAKNEDFLKCSAVASTKSHRGPSQRWLMAVQRWHSLRLLCVQPMGYFDLFVVYFERSYCFQTDTKGNKTKQA